MRDITDSESSAIAQRLGRAFIQSIADALTSALGQPIRVAQPDDDPADTFAIQPADPRTVLLAEYAARRTQRRADYAAHRHDGGLFERGERP